MTQAYMDIDRLLRVAIKGGASDVILKEGAEPKFRFNGELVPLSDSFVITKEQMLYWIQQIIPNHLKNQIEETTDLDFSYQNKIGNRFRVNMFKQRMSYAMVLRIVAGQARSLEELQLPMILKELSQAKRGLVLVTGATGTGKSTTLAAMIESINQSKASHIITVEDPIEVSFTDKKSTIEQREIGLDCKSFPSALRGALRQNPDVILVGELRDKETTETALMAAETGHLVLSTLHTNDAVETMTRILSYFPPEQHQALRIVLSNVINAIISQRLIPRANGVGMVPAFEILIGNAFVKEVILKGHDLDQLRIAMSDGGESYGMCTFDQSLMELYRGGHISKDTAIAFATRKEDFKLKLSGIAA